MSNAQFRSPGATDGSARKSYVAGGALAGAAVGVWAGKKIKEFASKERPEGMIDWNRTREIATGMNKGDTLTVADREHLDRYYGDLVAKCIPIVAKYTGTSLPYETERTFAFDRVDWINANLEGFRRMFEPLEALEEANGRGKNMLSRAWSGVNQTIVSYEVGLLLGYMARRVLGQYDLALLGREPVTSPGKLYYVEPNIRGVESKLGLPKEDFRMWLALHETTHAFEFEAHPWVRLHFNGLLDRYMNFLKQDAEFLKQGFQGLKVFARRVQQGRDDSESGGSWLEMLMDDEQRQLFNEMQAMMCVIEGYSNHVMNAVGKDLLDNYEMISRKFAERQKQRSQADQLFARLTGLDVKMEQYRQGERFIDQIVAERGHSFAHQVWDKPENLPSMDEIRNPDRWIYRIDSRAGAFSAVAE